MGCSVGSIRAPDDARQKTVSSTDEEDVPYSEDLQQPSDARAWVEAADRKRPLRIHIRRAIVNRLRLLATRARVLELGSGPGLLAEQVLLNCTDIAKYTLLDFSEPMLEMSRGRVARYPSAEFVSADFRSEGWIWRVTAPYDAVVSMQAVHEVRHKRHVPRLYGQVHGLLARDGAFLMADRVPEDDSPRSTALFMTEQEQTRALADAGFHNIRVVMSGDALVLCQCMKKAV
jgi:cyclopropane fatty-acyl-phospholipid synthase-like methyltransferase